MGVMPGRLEELEASGKIQGNGTYGDCESEAE